MIPQKKINLSVLLRIAGVCALLLWPQQQWAQRAADSPGQVSSVDVSETDTRPVPRVDGAAQGRPPALGERRPRGSFRGQGGTGENAAPAAGQGVAIGGQGASALEQGASAGGQGVAVQQNASGGDVSQQTADGQSGMDGSAAPQQATDGQSGGTSRGFSGRGGFSRGDASGQGGSRSSFSRTGNANAAADNGAAAEGSAERTSVNGRGSRSEAADDNTVQQLVMRDQALPDVLNFLEVLAKKSILRSQTLPAVKITFDSVGPMSREEAILAIESLLAINGIAVTPVGERFLKAAPSAEVAKQVPPFVSGSVLGMQPSQQFYTKYFKLDYLDALNEGQAIVQGLMSVASKQEGNPVVFPKSNSILVTDMLVNLQRIEEVLTRSDKPSSRLEGGLHFFRLKHVKASDLKNRLTALVASKDSTIGSAFTHNTSFEADDRTNQLVVVTHESNLPLLRQLIEGLDSDVEPQTGSEVYYIKHAVAKDVGDVLTAVITGQKQAREQASSSTNLANTQSSSGLPAGTPAAVPDTPSVVAATGNVLTLSDTRNLQFSDYVTVVADERANAIVIYGTKADLTQLGKLIEKIDVLLAQVNIQVIIAEVTLSDGIANGIEQLSIGYSPTDGWSAGAPGASYTGGTSPFDFKGTLDPKGFNLIINNAKTNNNFRMLSAPVIVTTHNKEGRVDVTEQRPIITGTSTQLLENPVSTSTVSYQNIGIKLTVKPLIGNNGIIQMEILQEVENISSFVSINGNDQPVIATRVAQSYVSVRSGEVVVLAGLQESSLTEKDNSLWLLGEIPLLGDLLNGRGKVVHRRELMIFIQPFIMTTEEEILQMTDQAISNLDNASDVRTYLQTRDSSTVTIEQARASREDRNIPYNRPVTRPDLAKAEAIASEKNNTTPPISTELQVAEPSVSAQQPTQPTVDRPSSRARGPRR